MPTRAELRPRVDAFLENCIARFYRDVPYGTHLAKAREVNLEYYKRHVIEIILRLRMKRTADALAIRYFTKHDPRTAKLWAEYTAEEMLHDAFFAADLARVGVSKEEIYATPPLFSTRLMIGYFYQAIEHEENPLALIASVYFVEYVTVRTQPDWIANLERFLGGEKVRGARAHVDRDVNDHHSDFVWGVLDSLVGKDAGKEELLFEHLENVYRLWEMFFVELHRLTVERPAAAAVPLDAAVPA